MKNYCDLHTHSIFSDGTYTPTQIIEEAERIGLAAVALTDHNTVAGLPELFRAAQGKQVQAIGGAEFSTDYLDVELHIIGLFIQEQHFAQVETLVKALDERKEKSNELLAKALNEAGYDVDYAAIKAGTPRGHINRAHFASALLEKGYVSSISEAFDSLLSKTGGYYQQPKRLDAFETIAFLKSIGCAVVLAHPFQELDEDGVRAFLKKAVPYGLDAIETNYAKYDAETVRRLQQIAAEYGVKESGGSDFHGERRKGTYLGVGTGDLRVPAQCVHSMKKGF